MPFLILIFAAGIAATSPDFSSGIQRKARFPEAFAKGKPPTLLA